MKNKLTILLILFSLTGFAQFKTVINPTNRVATLHKDTLFIHKPLNKPIEYAKFKLSYITINGKVYRFKIAYYDYSLFWSEQSKSKKKIYFY